MKSSKKVSFWNSLVVRFGLMFTALVMFCVLISGYLVFEQASSMILGHNKEKVSHDAQLARQSFYNLLNEVSNDIAVLTNNPSVLLYLKNDTEYSIEQVSSLSRVVLQNKPEYYQLRVLEVNEGNEILRFNKHSDDSISKTAQSLLQNKSDKEYYINAITNPDIEYYFSEINLNEEFGRVSIPHVPTLRAVGKIRDDTGQLRALLVINVDLTSFYSGLKQIMLSNSKLIISNNHGEYLFESSASKRFGKQLNSQESFQKDYNTNWEELIAKNHGIEYISDYQNNEFICQIDKLLYSHGQHQIYLFTLVDLELLLENAEVVRDNSLKTVFVICALALLFIFLFTRLLSRSINLITHAVSDFEHDNVLSSSITIPENRKDEVGLLARSFSKMKTRIDEQMMELKGALKREQNAIKERNEFLQNMSHELRTPLNAILGLTQLLNKNKPTPEQQPIIDSLKRSTTNLSGLMHDILDQHKLLEGRVKLKMNPSNIYELLQEIFAGYQYEAINKGLSIQFDAEESLKNRIFLIDSLRFNQIVTNVLVNAIKYTSQGSVLLSAGIDGEDPKNLVVEISDTGEGINPDKINQINDRFYQAYDESSIQTDGFGLGLSIVKQLVELFKGSLSVTSELKKGSVFSIKIPVTEIENSQRISPSSREEVSYPLFKNQYKVLHIEDDDSALLLVKNMLELSFISLTQTKYLDEAIALTNENNYDLILTDLMLGNENINKEVALNFIEKTTTPVLILSAFDQENVSILSPYYLQKPFDLHQLLDQIMVLIGRTEFDIPYLKGIYDQYDHRKSKIVNYLNILISEFSTYITRIEQVADGKNEKEWKAILHKLVTHIKSMRLDKLMGLLPDVIDEMSDEKMMLINNQLRFHLCYFRTQLRFNSED